MNPSEILTHVVQPKRGFEARPHDSNDRYRAAPSAPIADRLGPDVRGGAVGFGVDTVGAVQLTDRDGKQSWIAVGHFTKGGPENHAEARSLEALRAQAPKQLQGSRITVVVDQIVCPSCRERLLSFANEVGAETVEIYHPRMENERMAPGSGVMKSPKSSSKDSFRGPRDPKSPPVSVHLEERIVVRNPSNGPVGSKPSATAALHDTDIRTSVRGLCLNLGSGIALGIFQEWFKAKMLADLEKMPKLTLESDAKSFFRDPATQNGMSAIDVMGRNIEPFGRELAEHHQGVIGAAVLELIVLRVSEVPDEEKFEFLAGLQEELSTYEENLRIVERNLEAAESLAPQVLEAAQAATDLRRFVDNPLVIDQLFRQGFTLDEIAKIQQNLASFAAQIKLTFQAVAALHAQVLVEQQQLAKLSSEVNHLYWQFGLRIVSKEGQSKRLNHRWPPPPSSGPASKLEGGGGTKAPPNTKAAPQKPPPTIEVAPLM